MGIFEKVHKERESKSTNEIGNRMLKTNIVNHAMSLLEEGVDYDDLAYTTVDFGYLFLIENHGIEALFKITTDKDVLYFACQKESMLRVNLNEALFISTTEGFLDFHG